MCLCIRKYPHNSYFGPRYGVCLSFTLKEIDDLDPCYRYKNACFQFTFIFEFSIIKKLLYHFPSQIVNNLVIVLKLTLIRNGSTVPLLYPPIPPPPPPHPPFSHYLTTCPKQDVVIT